MTNPDTARRALYVSRLMSARIEGMDETESRDVLATLCDLIEAPENIYEHAWRPGDIIVWDNLSAMTGRRKNRVSCAAAPWKASCFTEFLLPLGYFNTKYERIDCNLT